MSFERNSTLPRWFFLTTIGGALLGSLVTFVVLGPAVGIKSGYVVIGLAAALAVYYGSGADNRSVRPTEGLFIDRRVYTKGVFTVALLSIAAVAGARNLGLADPMVARIGVLLVALPIGYALLTLQLRSGASTRSVLSQILVLFAVAPLTKYLATGFYIGNGDTPAHVRYVDLLVSNGTWQAIPKGSFYFHFPALHTLLGSVRFLSGLSSYDSYMIVGLFAYLVAVCSVYLVARLTMGDRVRASFVALATTLLVPIHVYTSHFHPQAFAVTIVTVLLYLTVRSAGDREGSARGAHTVISGLLVALLWFTHHLTVVLFLPILGLLFVAPPLVRRVGRTPTAVDPYPYEHASDSRHVLTPRSVPLVAWVLGSVAYWTFEGIFVGPLVSSVRATMGSTVVASESSSPVTLHGLGVPLPEPSSTAAILSLVSPGGVYNTILVCVLALGFIVLLDRFERYRRSAAFVLVGLVGSGLLLRTPLAVSAINRVQLPLSIFVAFVVGIGLYALVSGSFRPNTNILPAVFVVLLLSTSATAVAGDDVYPLHSGPDLWQVQPIPDGQKEFSERELTGLEQASTFFRGEDVMAATDWRSEIGLFRFGAEARGMGVRDERIVTDRELLLYRARWTEHSVRIIPEKFSFGTVLVSDAWLRRLVGTEDKVYTTGSVGVLRDREEGPYFESQPATTG